MLGKKRVNWLKFRSVGSAWHPAYVVGPTHSACTHALNRLQLLHKSLSDFFRNHKIVQICQKK